MQRTDLGDGHEIGALDHRELDRFARLAAQPIEEGHRKVVQVDLAGARVAQLEDAVAERGTWRVARSWLM